MQRFSETFIRGFSDWARKPVFLAVRKRAADGHGDVTLANSRGILNTDAALAFALTGLILSLIHI